MVNKTILGWDSLSHHCINLSNTTFHFLIRGFNCVLPSYRVTLNLLEGNPYPHK